MVTSRSLKHINDTGNGSDCPMTNVNRPDRELSSFTLSPRSESLVSLKVQSVSSLLTSGLQTIGLRRKANLEATAAVTKPTGNEDRAPTGMLKKWQQHYSYGKWIQLGKITFQVACVLFLVMCVLWSQLLYPLSLNSKTLFEAIVDAEDQAASSPTYIQWLNGFFSDEEELKAGYSLHSFYVWHITNPLEILERGFKPKLEEVGPFGYIKRTTKYNSSFDSAKVTYRSWTVYEPIDDPEDCKHMFFRMDKAKFRQGIPDCDGTTCNCMNDSQEVTVVNPPFLRLLQRYKPTGLLSSLSQEIFADIKEGLTVGFVRATKAYLLPAVLRDVYQFRKAFLTANAVLRSIFTSISTTSGTATAVSTLRGDYREVSIDCQGFKPSGYSGFCPWGLLSFIENSASSLGVIGTLSQLEAEFLVGLRSSRSGAIFDGGRGTLAWIAAGRYHGYITAPSMPHPGDTDITGEVAFNERVTTVCTWETFAGRNASSEAECEAKVAGILEWLFGVWFTEENKLEALVVEEWRGASVDNGIIVCDVIGGICPWIVVNGIEPRDWNINASAAALMIDPANDDKRNDLSLYTLDGQTRWSRAHAYCTASSLSFEVTCDQASHYLEAANVTLPTLLKSADSGSQDWSSYFEQVCGIASNMFHDWVSDSKWMDHVVANHLDDVVRDLTGYQLNGERIEDIGYVQWTTGAISFALLNIQTLSTIARDGIMEFMDESRHMLGPELWTQMAIAGYPDMGSLTVPAGKALLDILALDSEEANDFRSFILRQSTTYYGDSDDWWNGNSNSKTSSDMLFMEENPSGDFSPTAWRGSALSGVLLDAMAWMDVSYMSSPKQCDDLERLYESCKALVADGQDWPSNCVFFQTIMSNTVGGIECNNERIYDTPHPHPKKPGNVLANFMYTLAWEEVLKKEHILCDDPDDCEFSKGGYFTTRPVRDVIFEGYSDSLTIKMLNKELKARKLSIRCSSQHVVKRDMFCRPLYDRDCTSNGTNAKTGFEVIHDVYGTILEVNRTGSNKHLWHSAEIALPYDLGIIENPIFAVYPGGNWENESFQKIADCEKRTLQGDAGLWNSCDTTVHTGGDDPGRIGDTSLYYGNGSLLAADGKDSWLTVYGTDGTQDVPRKWEGFDEYKMTYMFRSTGLESLGNDTVVILKGEHLLQLHMARESSDVTLQYPTRYLAGDNVSLEIDIHLNRYIAQAQSWLDARERLGNDILRDFNGMTYMVPMGMVSTQLLTGYGTFISDPHFLTNDLLDQHKTTTAAEQMNNIAPDKALHQSHVDIEPVTGKVLRRAIRLQLLFRVERNAFSPSLMSSQSSATICRSPTKNTFTDGPGCFMYIPILWFDDQRVMDQASATTLQEEFLFFVDYAADTAWKGWIASSALTMLGGVLWSVFMYFKMKHDRRVWVD